ncbi:hypothetical protein [Bradyrhizobium sp.]|uniref:hypothetical protein n=1 Tax=Bradyrhizobium sp. TaxID=376 RepID=UPI0025C418E2|nr:hypothetical protein [Bradyrhizobium sp.]
MRRLVLSMLIAAVVVPAPAMAAALGKNPGASPAAAEVDDLLRRIERDLDRLTRGLNSDVAHIEKKRRPAATPAEGSPRLMQR